jgi:hypothetical protein
MNTIMATKSKKIYERDILDDGVPYKLFRDFKIIPVPTSKAWFLMVGGGVR